MDPRIRTILEYAVMAPSGDNCQPWKFAVDGLQVDLFNDPDQDRSLYNLKQRASLIAQGALLENIRLAALSVGLQSQVALLPDPANQEQIASILFTEGKTEQSPHFKAIPRRQTNRETYRPVKLSDNQVEAWQRLPDRPGQAIQVAHHDEQINALAKLLSLNDRLVFEVPALHRFLFEQLRWTDEEARRTGDGLDIKTLGLNTMDRWSFRLLKHWSVVAVFNRAGFPAIIQMKARQLIRSSSAIAIIIIPGAQTLNYIEGGNLWQRLLLQLSSEGLTAQPIAGLACLLQSAHEGLLETYLTESQRGMLLATRRRLFDYLGFPETAVILGMFRIGSGPQVTRALRRPLSSFLRP